MSQYLIQGETLTATADVIREKLGQYRYKIIDEVIYDTADRTLVAGAVTQYYAEYIDCEEALWKEDGIVEYDYGHNYVEFKYGANNDGVIVPILYANDEYNTYHTADYYQPFYYIGKQEIDGTVYDKWRKLELGNEDEGYHNNPTFGWDTDAQIYIYTNEIVEVSGMNPKEFPQAIHEICNDAWIEGYNECGLDNCFAYTVSSVDELPSDAVDGSMALVDVPHQLLGTWVFNETLSSLPYVAANIMFTSNGTSYTCLVGYGNIQYQDAETYTVVYSNGVWVDEAYRTITITEIGISETSTYDKLVTWLTTNATRTEVGGYVQALYVRENGEWVYKCEVA